MNPLRKSFEPRQAAFDDVTGRAAADRNSYWSPLVVSKATIDAEIQRLAELPKPANGRRESLIVHPMAPANAPGLAPGIQVKLSVLKPGESTAAFRHNATEVNFNIEGEGEVTVGDKTIRHRRYDVWNHPSFTPYVHRNTGKSLLARLTYSNVPLLQSMNVYLPEDVRADSDAVHVEQEEAHAADPARQSPFGMIPIGSDGGMLMPYETLINPTPAVSPTLHFPWQVVKGELDKLEALGSRYVGRRLYMMYNPLTTRFNGITPNFFATMTIRPPGIVDRPHRHVSAAINYYFKGRGFSNVAGNRYEWSEGDLMLSAPGWAVHNHASYDEQVYELTVQDQPLNIYMESLLWQEDMKLPAKLLGSSAGFDTNRAEVAA
ncbi:cupin domain-containing protein [Variovorax defluvii]|uniref:Cupin domain-containing protein n=1 Tax=Variovorax defluvii TaxID=913761 RepID=A0ABP8ICN7_9BURK